MERTIFLVRHGETAGNRERRFIGSTDLPLSSEGRDQAVSLKPLVSNINTRRCFCSPYLRCRETADILLEGSPLRPDIDDRIREVDFGKWEGMTFDEISSSYPELIGHWALLQDDFSFPQGEALTDFLERIRMFALSVEESHDEKILLVTHGGVIRFLLCHWLKLNRRHHIIFEIAFAALTTVKLYNGKGVLTGMNEKTKLFNHT
jgi:alpha-ribazole phosphatase